MHALAVLEIPIGLNIQISNLPARSHQIARAKAIVTVSFVVGVDGNVEDARLVESSDERFNTVSIEAIRQLDLPRFGGRVSNSFSLGLMMLLS